MGLPFEHAGLRQHLLNLFRPRQVVGDVGTLDCTRLLKGEACFPFFSGRIVVRRIARPEVNHADLLRADVQPIFLANASLLFSLSQGFAEDRDPVASG